MQTAIEFTVCAILYAAVCSVVHQMFMKQTNERSPTAYIFLTQKGTVY